MNTKTVAQEIAYIADAYNRCVETGNHEWAEKHGETLEWIRKQFLPSGAGIDSGCEIVTDECRPDKIVLSFGYHHMNDAGMYDGWTQHKAIIKPAFRGLNICITGPNRNDVKDYLFEVFSDAMDSVCGRINDSGWEHGWEFNGEWHKR